MIYVVLGMHKSGTTLVSQMLHHSGISMGPGIREDVSYDRGNKYEDQDALRMNMEFLGAADYEVHYLETPAEMQATPEQQERMQRFVRERNARYENWGFKDPRTCLTYPPWEPVLPTHRIIAVYRSPEEVWPRFRSQGIRRAHRIPRDAWEYLMRWCEHNENILRILHGTKMDRAVFSYRDLMRDDGEFRRLEEFVGSTINNRRKPGLYRRRPKRYRLLDWTAKRVKITEGYDTEAILRNLERLRSSSGTA